MLQLARAEMLPVDAWQDFFERNFVGACGAGAVRGHWGYMLVNTVLEMADVDDEPAARAEQLAAMLMLFNEGIRVSSRCCLADAQYLQPVATTFCLIRSAFP